MKRTKHQMADLVEKAENLRERTEELERTNEELAQNVRSLTEENRVLRGVLAMTNIGFSSSGGLSGIAATSGDGPGGSLLVSSYLGGLGAMSGAAGSSLTGQQAAMQALGTGLGYGGARMGAGTGSSDYFSSILAAQRMQQQPSVLGESLAQRLLARERQARGIVSGNLPNIASSTTPSPLTEDPGARVAAAQASTSARYLQLLGGGALAQTGGAAVTASKSAAGGMEVASGSDFASPIEQQRQDAIIASFLGRAGGPPPREPSADDRASEDRPPRGA